MPYNGILQTQEFVRSIFQSRIDQPIGSSRIPGLVMPNLGSDVCTDKLDPVTGFHAAQIATAGADREDMWTESSALTRLVGEAFARHMPNSMALPAGEANNQFVSSLRWFIARKTSEGERAIITSRDPNQPADINNIPAWITSDTEPIPAGELDVTRLSWRFFLERYPYTGWITANPLKEAFVEARVRAWISYFVTMSRPYTVTTNVVNKVIEALQQDLGIRMTSRNTSTSAIWDSWGEFFGPAEARALFANWKQWVPQTLSLRLNNLVLQASWGGLKAYIYIGQSMRMFPDFNWTDLRQWIAGEFANFDLATDDIAGDEYFGYSRNLLHAKQSLMPNLAYAAFQLLIEVGGMKSLLGYRGRQQNVSERLRIDRLIREYIEKRKGLRQLLDNDGGMNNWIMHCRRGV